jgi:glycosyltransferase involved in cell wall biosynthesis
LNIGHTGLNDPGFATWVRDTDVRPLYFVHDLIPITHPEYCRSGEQAKHVERMRTVLKTGVGVIGNSQATLDELCDFGSSEGLASLPEIAAWLGTDPWTATGTVAPPVRPTFVVLGTIEARKNHILLLQIWKRVVSRLGSEAPRLLIIGQRGWESDEVFALLDRGDNFGGAVTEMSDCTDAELARNLARARALLFPSLVEGYGLPLVEALRAGTPVIASDLPVFREIGGDVPDYLDPVDAHAWEQAILSYAEPDSPERTAQLKRMTGYQAPTWDEHFSRVEAWMAQF